jgi:hypothetical protein
MAPVEGRASPGQGKSLRTAQHRRAAAEWVRELTGAAVPHDSDRAFRAALTDGVILVHLLNALRPGAVARVVERDATSPTGAYIRAFENVSNFLEAAKQFTAESFSAADLEDDADRCALRAWLLPLGPPGGCRPLANPCRRRRRRCVQASRGGLPPLAARLAAGARFCPHLGAPRQRRPLGRHARHPRSPRPAAALPRRTPRGP